MTDPLNTKTTPPSLLLVILDIHPLSWSLLASPSADPTESSSNLVTAVHPEGPSPLSDKIPQTPLQLSEFITTLLVFLNAHLASRWGNQVVLFAAAPGRSRLLYPSPRADEMDVRPNVYHPFRLLNAGLEEGLRGMVKEEEERLKREEGQGLNDGPEKLDTRLLVINATPGSSDTDSLDGADGMNVDQTTTKKAGNASATGAMRGGYVGLMNCVFAAQKTKVPIDVLTLPSPATGTAPPIFLQQASHLTDGIYWRWNGKGGILQYLHTIYLAPPSLRQQPFAVPPQDAVDFRAVCFCHGDVVDIGFVCSVCLSIFCKPLPVCQMCKTKFPIKSLPNLKTLAADLTPIPVPQTIPPPKPKREKERREGKENGAKDRVREEIVIS